MSKKNKKCPKCNEGTIKAKITPMLYPAGFANSFIKLECDKCGATFTAKELA